MEIPEGYELAGFSTSNTLDMLLDGLFTAYRDFGHRLEHYEAHGIDINKNPRESHGSTIWVTLAEVQRIVDLVEEKFPDKDARPPEWCPLMTSLKDLLENGVIMMPLANNSGANPDLN